MSNPYTAHIIPQLVDAGLYAYGEDGGTPKPQSGRVLPSLATNKALEIIGKLLELHDEVHADCLKYMRDYSKLSDELAVWRTLTMSVQTETEKALIARCGELEAEAALLRAKCEIDDDGLDILRAARDEQAAKIRELETELSLRASRATVAHPKLHLSPEHPTEQWGGKPYPPAVVTGPVIGLYATIITGNGDMWTYMGATDGFVNRGPMR